MNVARIAGLFATAFLIGLSGCTGSPPAVTPGSPDPQPSAADDGVYFLEEFNGTELDPERWEIFPQSGIILVKDGRLDLLNGGMAKNFPYIVSRELVVPQRGPFSFELAYEVMATGQYSASFCLDYVPPVAPGEPALVTPFMRTLMDKGKMQVTFQTEAAAPIVVSAEGAEAPGALHRLRVEFDGVNTYEAFIDDVSLGTFTSKRRPLKFWVGSFESRDYPENFWPRVALDRILVKRVASPVPDAAASPTPSATGEAGI